MNRITQNDLQALVNRINRITKSPETPYKATESGNACQVGNYHLDSAYGGVSLVRMHNEAGGVQSIIPGFHSKRDLYNRMQAFVSGLEA